MHSLSDKLPWTCKPLIVNAPMAGFCDGAFAAQVSLAGGLGLIGSLFDMKDARTQLQMAADAWSSSSSSKAHDEAAPSGSKTLPVGIGFLPFVLELDHVLAVLEDYKPAVVWLFAAHELGHYSTWTTAIRRVSPDSMVWIQVGSVQAALYLAEHVKPDALCLQGIDAGGHGFEKGAGIISLVPETSDALARAGHSHTALLASGSIADGRGVAAAMALGAQGVVMGTRFLAAQEVHLHPQYLAAILEAQDGGQTTTRSKFFDQLAGPSRWPLAYDGRSLVVQSYTDHVNGASVEEIQRLHNEAKKAEHKGYATGMKGRAAIWAGTGVGLVNEVTSAREIVQRVREEAKEIMQRLAVS